MGLFDRLFGRTEKADVKTALSPGCLHTALAPRWDSADDIGHEDRAASFTCDACHQSFTPQEAQALRESETDRLKTELDLDTARDA